MICKRTRAVAQADLQHLISRTRMRPIDALTPDERRTQIWGDDYDGARRDRADRRRREERLP